MKLIGQIAVLLMILLPLNINSQLIDTKKEVIAFYTAMAQKDALFEQSIRLDSQEDEADFWNDQKNFEQSLKQHNYTAYKAYLQSKKEAYSHHEQHCEAISNHGEYYYLQASFYYVYGTLEYTSTLAKTQRRNIRTETESISKH